MPDERLAIGTDAAAAAAVPPPGHRVGPRPDRRPPAHGPLRLRPIQRAGEPSSVGGSRSSSRARSSSSATRDTEIARHRARGTGRDEPPRRALWPTGTEAGPGAATTDPRRDRLPAVSARWPRRSCAGGRGRVPRSCPRSSGLIADLERAHGRDALLAALERALDPSPLPGRRHPRHPAAGAGVQRRTRTRGSRSPRPARRSRSAPSPPMPWSPPGDRGERAAARRPTSRPPCDGSSWPRCGRLAPEVLQTAKDQRWPPEELLRTLLEAELASRDASNARARLRAAGFPVTKTLEEFQVAASSVPRATFDYLASLEWIRARENLVLVGPAGTGKSHLLVGDRPGGRGGRASGSATSPAHRPRRDALPAGSPTTPWAGSSSACCGHDLVIVDELGFAPLDDVGTPAAVPVRGRRLRAPQPGGRLPLAVRVLGPLPARAHHRGVPARPAAPSRLDGRHRGRDSSGCSEARSTGRWLARPSPETAARGGDFSWPPVGTFTWPLTPGRAARLASPHRPGPTPLGDTSDQGDRGLLSATFGRFHRLCRSQCHRAGCHPPGPAARLTPPRRPGRCRVPGLVGGGRRRAAEGAECGEGGHAAACADHDPRCVRYGRRW